MLTDIGTIMWKEWKELLDWRNTGGTLRLLLLIGIVGFIIPSWLGRALIESLVAPACSCYLSVLLVAAVIPDSFAGERERHTLETLLASRLTDRTILFGKICAVIAYGVSITWLSLLLGLLTASVAHGQGKLLVYSPTMALCMVGFSLLSAGLVAGAGVLISLRATGVRQAQQTMSMLFILPFIVGTFGVQAIPVEWEAHLYETLMRVGMTGTLVIAAALLAAADLALFGAAMARFRRTRLIL